jgi:quinol monooxygenase YgiN
MIYVIATLHAKEGKQSTLIEGARAVIAATRKEEGCLFYDLHQSVTDPQRLVFIEGWTSRDALAAHFKTPHLQTWRGIAAECTARPTEVEIISPAGVERL